jgi:dipeptidyl aminopeptidase/acylaminoacyl peptidase
LGRVPGSADEMFVSANDRTFETQDLYRMNLRTGRKVLVSISTPGNVMRWVLDKDNVPRAALSMDAEKKRWWFSYQAPGKTEWTTLAQWDENLRGVVIPVAFDPVDPRFIYVTSNVGRDTLAFFRFDLEAGKLGEMVAGTDRYDMGSFLLVGMPLGEGGQLLFGGTDDEPGKLIGLRVRADKLTTVWFDDEARRLQAAVDKALPGHVNLFDPRQKRSLVRSYSATDPGAWYFFDKDKLSLEDTGIRARPWIDPAQMAPMTYVTYAARDGMKIGAYLTLPKAHRKGSPSPFVVLPHGGPWAKDNWEFDAEVQFLASRGYAVLQPNFRGSTGYGAQHLRASYKQWGASMTDDIIDGVEWAIREGYADRNRIGVYGASYGGFATLSVMTKRPDLFKWGVNYVGVTDMTVHQDTQPAQLRGDFTALAKALTGDQRADAAAFAAQSPARHVDKIAAPVFHAYGGQDRNVDFANGREIRSAFDKAGKPYEWMFVGDEAHGYRQTKNVVEFYSRFEQFIKANTPAAK